MKTAHQHLLTILLVIILVSCRHNAREMSIIIADQPGSIATLAAEELQTRLARIYPGISFAIRSEAPESGPYITLGTLNNMVIPDNQLAQLPDHPEGYLVYSEDADHLVITSNGELGILYGVYHYLETLGCRFLLDTEYIPEHKEQPDFSGIQMANEPLVNDRYANPWEVYLEGCSSWSLEKWKQYIDHVQRMGFNSLLVHAYGNDPMFTFDFRGMTKPVGHLTSSVKGRGWGQKHVNDVRRMPGGDQVFKDPAFGSERAIVADSVRVERSQEFMGEVFRHAAGRGVRVNFALDFDILSNIPQELVLTLPEKDRYQVSFDGIDWMGEKGGTYWIPRPDTPEGYSYYKSQLEQVLKLYPDISSYTLWRRRQNSIYCEIQVKELPAPWKREYSRFIEEHPGAGELPQAASSFAQRKLAQTYRNIFDELGRKDIDLAIGSWHLYNDLRLFETLEVFTPEDMKIIILDSEITRSEINLQNAEWITQLSSILSPDRYVPIIWAHHDDGEYVGSPFPEFKNFHDLLKQLKADGFGVIHWINRPLDLFFMNHMRQVWRTSQNESSLASCHFFSGGIWHDDPGTAELMGDYLYNFWQQFPPMSRANSAYVFDRPLSEYGNPDSILNDIQQRLDYLQEINAEDFSDRQKEFLKYCINYEHFLKMFIENQLMYEKVEQLMEDKRWDEARQSASSFYPEQAMEQLALTAGESYITHGDMGLVFSLGVRWLPHFINLKQGLGMEALRINFDHTQHEALAQMPGKDSYFIDDNQDYWKVMGKKECAQEIVSPAIASEKYSEIFHQGLKLSEPFHLQINTLADPLALPKGAYLLEIMCSSEGDHATLQIETEDSFHTFTTEGAKSFSMEIELPGRGIPEITISEKSGRAVLCGLILQAKPSV